jgi:hypothetical protein
MLGEGGALSSLAGAGIFSFGGCKSEMSSPSSARRAITFPTGTFLEPSGIYPNDKRGIGAEGLNSYQDFAHNAVVLSLYIDGRLVRFL